MKGLGTLRLTGCKALLSKSLLYVYVQWMKEMRPENDAWLTYDVIVLVLFRLLRPPWL